jgi:hypothetical protein
MGDLVKRRLPLLLALLFVGRPSFAEGPAHPPAGPAATAAAQSNVAVCTVRLIQVHPTGTEFDPRLEPLRKQFTQPPFSAWHSFRLIQQNDLDLPKDVAKTFALPGQHKGSLTYMGREDGPKRHRVRMHLELFDGAARLTNNIFLIDDGGTYLYAGFGRNAGGIQVLGFTCRQHDGPSRSQ